MARLFTTIDSMLLVEPFKTQVSWLVVFSTKVCLFIILIIIQDIYAFDVDANLWITVNQISAMSTPATKFSLVANSIFLLFIKCQIR